MYVYDDHPFQPPIPSSPASASTGAAYLGLSYPSFNPVYDAPFYAQGSVPTSSSSSSLAAALEFPQPDKSQSEPVDRTRPIPALPRGGPPENLNLEAGANFDPNLGRTVERTRDNMPNIPREHVNPSSKQNPHFPDSEYHLQSQFHPLPHQSQPHPQSQPQPQAPLPPHTHHFPPDATSVFQSFDSWPPSADAFTADSSLHGFHGSFSGGGAPDFSGEPFAFFPNDPAAYYSEPLPAHLFADGVPGGWGGDAGMGFGEACFDFSGAAAWEPPPAAFVGQAPMPVLQGHGQHEQSMQVASMAPPSAPALGHAGGGNGSNAQFASASAARPDAGLARDRSRSLSVSVGAPVVGAFGSDYFHASAHQHQHQHQHQQLQELQHQHQQHQQHAPGGPSAEVLGFEYSPHSQASLNHMYAADHGIRSTGADGDRDLRRPASLGADEHREVCIITFLFYFVLFLSLETSRHTSLIFL
ncbi:hypothetical protein DFH11DRAFT_1220128 [Phellopilus nigrolimitatus]|nr:hypothetical protein DFH11DRAFT_1220128 [Phellopilus nigrolimitatus]